MNPEISVMNGNPLGRSDGSRDCGLTGALAAFVRRGVLAMVLIAPHAALAQAPFVPTPMGVVDAMLEIAGVGPKDFVIDLGSGDGRIVIAAAKRRGASGLGVDLDGGLVSDARREAARQGVAGRVQFLERNIFVTEIDKATVVTLYLFPQLLRGLRPKLFAELQPGTRVVSHEFDFDPWKPDAQVRVPVPDKPYGPPWSDVYMWIIPANAAGRWQWQGALAGVKQDFELNLEQTFQHVRGSARVAGRPARLESAELRGDELRFALVAEADGRPARFEFAGRLTGDTIRGKMRVANAESGLEWQATRTQRGKMDIGTAAPVAVYAANY